MSKRNLPLDHDEFPSATETLSRKQVMEALRRGTSLADADMRGADLAGLSFDGADLRRAKMAEASLNRCTFRGAILAEASLWGANLKDAVLDGASLEGADLDFANLDGCTMKAAKVRRAIFPLAALPVSAIEEAVRTGRKVRMDARQLHLEEDE